MSFSRVMSVLGLAFTLVSPSLRAQSMVVDEGTFAITLAGKPAGTETFQIRRSGVGADAIAIAQGHVHLDESGGKVELIPLLEDSLADGAAVGYHLKASGTDISEMSLKRAGRRYVSLIRSKAGEEQREFLARPGTRILEEDVAHQYYFLHDVTAGARIPIIEPRTRKEFELTASGWTDVELHLGNNLVQARRITFTVGTKGHDPRTVWYDRQGRVLKVAVPSRHYIAERTDLVG